MKVVIKGFIVSLIIMIFSAAPIFAHWSVTEQRSTHTIPIGEWNTLNAMIWTGETSYSEGDIIFYNNHYYVALKKVPKKISPDSPAGSNFWLLY